MAMVEPIEWIAQHVDLQPATFGSFFYGRIPQWSPGRLPGINCAFDPTRREHFVARARELDYATAVGDGRILDFGPGDGWPALRIAPMVERVVGVEASAQRVETCRRNARGAGVENAQFVLAEPGQPLPFDDERFDGAVASWSLEESPDLAAALRELLRVLRPGAKLRFERVPLSFFARGEGTPMYVGDALNGRTIVLIGQPETRELKVRYTGLLVDLPQGAFRAAFERRGLEATYEAMTDEVLQELRPHIVEAGRWETRNPDCTTWLNWLPQLGFRRAETTYGGGWAAERYFDRLGGDQRPGSEKEADALLRPLVEAAVTMRAPSDLDTPITATR